MKFVQLILRKIIKIVVTRCQILRLKCTKFDFGWVREKGGERRRREGRGGLSGNVAEEAFCLKSAPGEHHN